MVPALRPNDSRRDLRTIHRDASARVSAAVRQGHVRDAVRWGRAVKRAWRALRFAARIRAGTVKTWIFDDSLHLACSHRSHPLFSGTPKKVRETPAPSLEPQPDRRRAFRERRRRR